ncbi:HAMP domain-containing protein [bacterium]|nr:HAMP domain-containing protein [bacterium]
MRFLQYLSRNFRTLRLRLMLWNTLVVLIAVLGALLFVREGLRFYLLSEADVVLNDEAKELLLAIERWHPDQAQIIAEMQQKASGHADRKWFIRWLSPNRDETIWSSDNAPEMPLNTLAFSLGDHRVWVSDTHRCVERKLNHPRRPSYYVRVGMPTHFVQDDVAKFTRIAVPVALAIFLLAPLGGYFLSEQAVHPLQRLIRTTERLRPSKLNERLEVRGVGDELDQLAAKINNFLDQIAAHLREHRDFVANAAHELRSPLAAILSSVEVALDKSRSPEEYQELLYSIDDECRHLSQLVNQLLQLAESESENQKPNHVIVDLSELVHKAEEMFGPVAEERQVKLVCETQGTTKVLGDRQQLRQVITNLIDNAIKFTLPNGEVRIIARDIPEEHMVEVTVSDTGVGIPAVDLPRIFERFYQVDRSRSRMGAPRGNGLGLSICEAIVQKHHGTLTVESQINIGTTFKLRIPAQFAARLM